MHSNEIDSALIDRYLAGELSDQESRVIENWFAKNPAEKGRILAIHARASDRFGPVPSYDVDARVASIVDFSKRSARRIHDEAGAYRLLMEPQYSNNADADELSATGWRAALMERAPSLGWTSKYVSVATFCAVALVIVAIGALRSWGAYPPPSADSYSVYTTRPGERATITLPDSSRVVLSVASRLEVPTDYGQRNRTLRLDGEAYFSVAQAKGNPFTVIAGPSTTQVLGTRFTVRHYADDSLATVSVQDGKVSVQSQTLTALQQAIVSANGSTQLRAANTGQFTFAEGILTLEEQTLSSAIGDLNRWYDVDIRLANERLKTMMILGEFDTGSITDLVELLQLTLNVRIERNGRILTLFLRD